MLLFFFGPYFVKGLCAIDELISLVLLCPIHRTQRNNVETKRNEDKNTNTNTQSEMGGKLGRANDIIHLSIGLLSGASQGYYIDNTPRKYAKYCLDYNVQRTIQSLTTSTSIIHPYSHEHTYATLINCANWKEKQPLGWSRRGNHRNLTSCCAYPNQQILSPQLNISPFGYWPSMHMGAKRAQSGRTKTETSLSFTQLYPFITHPTQQLLTHTSMSVGPTLLFFG